MLAGELIIHLTNGDWLFHPIQSFCHPYVCALVRHRLITPQARICKRSDYVPWERSRSMELWQMDIVGGVKLADGSEAKIVSGIDDHSRLYIGAAGGAGDGAADV